MRNEQRGVCVMCMKTNEHLLRAAVETRIFN